MNIRQLEIFRVVAETGSITRAATELYLSQPAVSKAIRELEASIGVHLFDRVDNRLHLNVAGRTFRLRGLQLLRDYGELQAFGQEQAGQLPLRVGTSLTIGQLVLPQAVARFQQLHPQTPLTVYAENVRQIKARLVRGDIDVAFVEGFTQSKAFQTTKLSVYRLGVFGAPSKFNGASTILASQLPELPWLLREAGSTLRDHFDERLHQLNVAVDPVLESVNTQVLIGAAVAGMGLTVLPEPLAKPYVEAGTLTECTLPGAPLETLNYAISLAGQGDSPVLADLVACFRDAGM